MALQVGERVSLVRSAPNSWVERLGPEAEIDCEICGATDKLGTVLRGIWDEGRRGLAWLCRGCSNGPEGDAFADRLYEVWLAQQPADVQARCRAEMRRVGKKGK
jgi:hypothetical protein